jgi:hypothetical protein
VAEVLDGLVGDALQNVGDSDHCDKGHHKLTRDQVNHLFLQFLGLVAHLNQGSDLLGLKLSEVVKSLLGNGVCEIGLCHHEEARDDLDEVVA